MIKTDHLARAEKEIADIGARLLNADYETQKTLKNRLVWLANTTAHPGAHAAYKRAYQTIKLRWNK